MILFYRNKKNEVPLKNFEIFHYFLFLLLFQIRINDFISKSLINQQKHF
ncbi:unnamed protein product [Fructobacillus evanidus]|uniref:Uncharacterized protein n=1 Tax=Fructobacillus evanidus TaxID=3064281 RepID=A0ABM9MYC3_9LACO|nr:unnamed protein product [Fructobacillus sp. LMG 32999]CAK1241900.1 unnamed protein product [Fructobacillus sp. LMG 32999]CAK1248484.1 unnamed protein product [Fructobacillus sp. LMG 32999]CAK1248708.1 unnamed protein product [Fructobacillus sp. LMG 32999]CAK1250323.1 unnamed protein product [Fructobacillus sp. LMG 32999]